MSDDEMEKEADKLAIEAFERLDKAGLLIEIDLSDAKFKCGVCGYIMTFADCVVADSRCYKCGARMYKYITRKIEAIND